MYLEVIFILHKKIHNLQDIASDKKSNIVLWGSLSNLKDMHSFPRSIHACLCMTKGGAMGVFFLVNIYYR